MNGIRFCAGWNKYTIEGKEQKYVSRKSIDFMKGWLTLLMVFSHIIKNIAHGFWFTDYVNLTTFSGFLFCFGYITYKIYLSKVHIPKSKVLKGFFKTIITYYLSMILFIVLVERNFSLNNLLDYLLQKKLAGYSEFLITWGYLYLLIILFGSFFKKILNCKYLFLTMLLLSLLFTFVPYKYLTIPWFGPLFGYGDGCFPLFQFAYHYLIGAYFAKENIVFNRKVLLISFLSTGAFVVYTLIFNTYPRSSNPHLLWVIGSSFFIYAYYLLANKIQYCNISSIQNILSHIGKHTLIYLLFSNGVIFSIKYFGFNVANLHINYFMKFTIIIVIYLLTLLVSYCCSAYLDRRNIH